MQVICSLGTLQVIPFPKFVICYWLTFLEGAYSKGVVLPLQLTGCGVLNGSPQQAFIYRFMPEDRLSQVESGRLHAAGWLRPTAIVS